MVGWSWAQKLNSTNLITRERVNLQQGYLNNQDSVSALVIKKYDKSEINPIVITTRGLYSLPLDPDVDGYTYFLSFSTPETIVSIQFVTEGDSVYHILHTKIPTLTTKERIDELECELPKIIEPKEWRIGLANPNYTRTYQSVSHVIIHHSAGSNTATDYTKLVRDIYLYHTEVNRWSDIGYNFLVAPDGTIYQGRDPAGRSPLEVMGAHFCGKNNSTVGICMLGNYEEIEWTTNSRKALEKLLVYVTIELGIDLHKSSEHEGQMLNHLAGHRDGCATICPGKSIYEGIDELADQVMMQNSNCIQQDIILNIPDTALVGKVVRFSANTKKHKDFRWNISPNTFWINSESLDYTFDRAGSYIVTLSAQHVISEKLVRLSHEIHIIDSATIKIYPNPSNGCFEIVGIRAFMNISISDASGKQHLTQSKNQSKLCLTSLKKGVYFITVMDEKNRNIDLQKLIIQ